MNDERATQIPREATSRGSLRPVDEDDPLGAALRAMPAERAGAGFAARVLARLDEGDAGRRGAAGAAPSGERPVVLGPAGWAALAAAAALAVALGLALARGRAPAADEAVARVDPAAESLAEAAPGVAAPAGSGIAAEAAPEAAAPDGPEGTGIAAEVAPGAAAPAGTGIAADAAVAPSPAPPEPAGSGVASAEAARPPSAPGGGPAGAVGASGTEVERAPSSPRRSSPHRTPSEPERAEGSRRASARLASTASTPDVRSALERVRAELDALRREHRAFEVALTELPEIGRDGQPVVFLGGDEGLGLVLDLGRESAAGDAMEAGERPPSL